MSDLSPIKITTDAIIVQRQTNSEQLERYKATQARNVANYRNALLHQAALERKAALRRGENLSFEQALVKQSVQDRSSLIYFTTLRKV